MLSILERALVPNNPNQILWLMVMDFSAFQYESCATAAGYQMSKYFSVLTGRLTKNSMCVRSQQSC